jgi:hypothetical protein
MEARKIFVILVIFPMDAVRARNRLADWRKDDPSATITLMETKGICSAVSENRWKTDGPEESYWPEWTSSIKGSGILPSLPFSFSNLR